MPTFNPMQHAIKVGAPDGEPIEVRPAFGLYGQGTHEQMIEMYAAVKREALADSAQAKETHAQWVMMCVDHAATEERENALLMHVMMVPMQDSLEGEAHMVSWVLPEKQAHELLWRLALLLCRERLGGEPLKEPFSDASE
jgi:hypothetical protein